MYAIDALANKISKLKYRINPDPLVGWHTPLVLQYKNSINKLCIVLSGSALYIFTTQFAEL